MTTKVATHTPGPWVITQAGNIAQANAEQAHIYADYDRRECQSVIEYRNPLDAALIAAAPELLAALEAITSKIGHIDHEEAKLQGAVCRACQHEALIRSAKGE